MAPAEDEDEGTPLPPDRRLSQLELAIILDRMSRDIRSIRKDLKTAKENDDRFAKVEHDFRIVKWAVMIACAAALGAVVNGVASRMSFRISDAPTPTSNAERMGSDQAKRTGP